MNGFSTKFTNHLSRFITLKLRISILTLWASVGCWYIMIVIQENIKNYGARKEALNLMGFEVGECRLPLVRMSDDKIEKLKASMNALGLIK